MAMDSIIARPTNKVRVMVVAASGCCASELRAVATARPSPSAGAMLPTPIVAPAVTIETIAIKVVLSIGVPRRWWSCRAHARGGRDVNSGQNAEDVSLHHAGEQTEQVHEDRKDQRRDRQQDADDHRPAHDVAEQADGQGKGAREFADDVE